MFINNIRSLIICLVIFQLGWRSSAASPSQTTEAVRYARSEEMRRYINESVDPCVNFYEYACGNWKPSEDHGLLELGVVAEAHDKFNRMVTEVLMEDDRTSSSVDKKVKMFYASCINMVTSISNLKQPLEKIAQEFGIMPAMDENGEFDEHTFDWQQTVAEIAYKYDIKIIVAYDTIAHLENNSLNIMVFDTGDFPLGRTEFYLNEEYQEQRDESKIEIAAELQTFFGVTEELAEQTASEIVDFEVSLHRGTIGGTFESLEDVRTTVDSLHRKYSPGLNIKKMLNTSFGSIPTNVVYEGAPNYQNNLINVMGMTPKRVVANYIFYRLLKTFIPEIPREKSALQNNCLEYTKTYFSKNLDNIFYRKYNSKDMEQGVKLMWQDIKTTFKSLLESYKIEWMGYATRRSALEKLEAMTMEILTYENYDFNNDFSHLIFSTDNYVGNLKSVFRLQAIKARAKFSAPAVYDYKGFTSSYSPMNVKSENRVKIPMCAINPYDFFSDFYPSAINFAQLGSLVGHEVIHGFDDSGAKRDKNGNPANWWDASSAAEFAARIQCFHDQYKAYLYNDRPLPLLPMASQGENMADNAGLRLAYEAYRKFHEIALRTIGKADLETLPGINYSSDRMFFISFAQMYCSYIPTSEKDSRAATDNHSPPEIRVIGTVSNFEEFAKEFNCPRGSPMNPVKKCKLI